MRRAPIRSTPCWAARLDLCTRIVLGSESPSPHAILGTPDDLKIRSCMTLFSLATDDPDNPFHQAFDLVQRTARRADARAYQLEPHCPELEPEPHLADPAEDGGGEHCVLQARENIAQAALQRVRRHDDRGARMVKANTVMSRAARVSVCAAWCMSSAVAGSGARPSAIASS
jgi:hypothetical protein